jgi:hypothetical protein
MSHIKAVSLLCGGFLAVLGGVALAQQDKYTLSVPGGLAFSEFRGYEGWQWFPPVRMTSWSLSSWLIPR